jgi:hypothetical protein
MPKPMICLSAVLCKYLELFRGHFSKRQWKYFVTVLQGLIECEGRRTLRGLLRSVWEKISLSGLSRFLSRWSWSAEEVAQTWQDDFQAEMIPLVQAEHARQRAARPKRSGRPRATVVTGYLVLDDSVQFKPKGRRMEGLGCHYSGCEKRKVSGHSLFSGLYVLLGRRCPLPPRLYRQQAVCEQEGVPFQSKVDLAVSTIQEFEPVPGTHTHILTDAWYHCYRLRRVAGHRDWDLSGRLKKNRMMRPGGNRTKPYLRLDEYAATLTAADWVEATWPSQQGGHPVFVHAVSTWVRKLGPTLLVITRLSLDESLSKAYYWGSTLVDADAQTVINVLAVRWSIETLFEDYKDLLGIDHYQLMRATAIVRFWTLVSCLTYFLDKHGTTLQAQRPGEHITRGDVRRVIQAEHQRNFLLWLEELFQSGITAGELCTRLAA